MKTRSLTTRTKAALAIGAFGVASIISAAPASASTSPNVIEPGVGTSQVELGMSRSQVLANFSDYRYAQDSCGSAADCYLPGDNGYVRIFFDNQTVDRLEFTDHNQAGWDTTIGIGFGTSQAEASAILGQPVINATNELGIVTDTITAANQGYKIEYLPRTSCTDSGCVVVGYRHRHYIFAADGTVDPQPPTTIVTPDASLEADGPITVTNEVRRRLRRQITVTVTDSDGDVVGSIRQRVNLRRGQSVDIDPGDVIDIDESEVGTYNWSATFTRRGRTITVDTGSFNVVEAAN